MNLDGAKTTINVSAMNSVRKNKGDSSGYEHSQSTEEVNIKQDEANPKETDRKIGGLREKRVMSPLH